MRRHTAPAILALLTGAALAQPFDLRIVIAEGDSLPDGTRFQAAQPISTRLASDGSVTLLANLFGGLEAILSDRDGAMTTIARQNQPAEGTDGVFGDFFTLRYAGDRSILFRAGLVGDLIDCNNNGFAENDHGLFIDDGDGPRLLLREDDDLPGAPPFRAALIGNLHSSPFSGAFGSFVVTRTGECPNFSESSAIYLIDRGRGLGPLVIPGEPAPIDGAVFANTAGRVRFNPNDPTEVLFTAELEGDGFFEANDLAFVTDRDGERTIRMRESDPVPGRDEFTIGPIFTSPSLRTDIFTWVADLRRPDGSRPFMEAVMRIDQDDNLETLLVSEDPAPLIENADLLFLGINTPPGGDFPHTIGGADDGATAIRAIILGDDTDGENNEVMYHIDADNNFTIIAREGDQAPEYPDGVTLNVANFFDFQPLGKPWMTTAGDVFFTATLRGGGFLDQRALYFFNAATGSVSKIIGPADTVDLGGGDLREVISLDTVGPNSTAPIESPVNLSGSLIFSLELEGGLDVIMVADPAGCASDLDGDGDADADDFFVYLDLFAADDPAADLDNDGDTDADDFFTYLDLFAQGCQ